MADEKVSIEIEVLQKEALARFESWIKEIQKANAELKKADGAANAASKAYTKVETSLAKSTKGISSFSKVGEFASKQLTSIGQNALSNIPVLGKYAGALQGIGGSAGTAVVALGGVTVAVAGVTAGMAAFFALGKRGAALQPTLNAFGNIAGAGGDATGVLSGLREQTRGTISDFELMRLSVLSLQGTSESFRKEVAPNIGTIADVTNRVAQATGQSAETVREKFFLGLRRQSKLLLDDVGVTVDKTSAEFRKLSAEIGDEAAYSRMAIEKLKEVGGELGAINFVQEALNKPLVFLQNTLDKLALAIQPAFAPIATAIGKITDGLTYLSSFVFPIIQAGAKIIGAVLSGAFRIAGEIIQTLFAPQLQFIATILPYVAAAAQIAGDAIVSAINGAVNIVSGAIQGISGAISSALSFFGITRDNLLGDTNKSLTEIGVALAKGGGAIIGSFAAGMARGATKVVTVVTKIAQIVADFLQGFSPPKTGPLSQIDTGGANVINAWADGMLQGFVNPVDKIAEEVNSRLGNIANFSIAQVDMKLSQLDQAIRPFRENLDIAKSDFEAMAGFADPVLKALERQQQKALKGFAAGDVDADRVQQLDKQIQQFNELKDLAESRADQAQIDLAVAEARQAQERALLKIQKDRLGGVSTAVSGGGASAEKKAKDAAKKAGGGGAGGESDGGGGGLPLGGKAPDLLSNTAIDAARSKIEAFGNTVGGAFTDSFGDATSDAFGDFDVARGGLDAQLARIKSADPVQKIKDKFSGLETTLTQPLTALQTQIDTFQTNVSTKFNAIKTDIELALTGIATSVLGESGVFAMSLTALDNKVTSFKIGVSGTFRTLKTDIQLILGGLTAEGGILSATGTLGLGISALFGEAGVFTVAFTTATTTLGTFRDTVSTILDEINAKFELVFANQDGTIQKIGVYMQDAVALAETALSNFANNGVGSALTSLGQGLATHLGQPFADAVNGILDGIANAINSFINSANKVLSIVGKRIEPFEPPSFTFPVVGAASGAMGLKGTFMAGEKGAELITTQKPATVFPAKTTRTLQQILAKPSPMMLPSGGDTYNTNNNQRTQNNNISVGNTNDALLLMRQLEASYR